MHRGGAVAARHQDRLGVEALDLAAHFARRQRLRELGDRQLRHTVVPDRLLQGGVVADPVRALDRQGGGAGAAHDDTARSSSAARLTASE